MKVLIYKYIEKFSFSKATHAFKRLLTKIEQGGGGVGGRGVRLSPWIHQEYTFRLRKRAESRQEYLTSSAQLSSVASVVSNSVRPHRRQPTRLPRHTL